MNLPIRLHASSAALALLCLVGPSLPAARAQTAPALSVDLVIAAAGAEAFDGSLVIRNGGDAPVSIEHPGNRMAHGFVVTGSTGNLVTPTPLAQVEAPFRTITIPSGGEYRYTFRQLSYLTETGLFGYVLAPGSYRVIGIYRPAGGSSAGYTTPERLITVPAGRLK